MSKYDAIIPRRIGPKELNYLIPYSKLINDKIFYLDPSSGVNRHTLAFNQFMNKYKKDAPISERTKIEDHDYLMKWIIPCFSSYSQGKKQKDLGSKFRKRNIYSMVNNYMLINAFNHRCVPFFNLAELKLFTELYIDNWKRNQEQLIETGRARHVFNKSLWMCDLISFLYPVRLSYNLRYKRKDAWGDTIYGYKYVQEKGGLNDISYCDANIGIWRSASTIQRTELPTIKIHGIKQYIEYKEDALACFSDEEVNLIERKRESLYMAYISIFTELHEALLKMQSEHLLGKCIKLLNKFITPRELDIYIKYDNIIANDKSIAILHHNGRPGVGSLSSLFELIGHYEKEIRIKTMHLTRQQLEEIVRMDQYGLPQLHFIQNRYFHTNRKSYRDKIDGAIDYYFDLEEQEREFWSEYYMRVELTLKEIFGKGPVKPKYFFKPFLEKLKEHFYEQRLTLSPVSCRTIVEKKIEDTPKVPSIDIVDYASISKKEACEIQANQKKLEVCAELGMKNEEGETSAIPSLILKRIGWKDITLKIKDKKLYAMVMDSANNSIDYEGELEIENTILRNKSKNMKTEFRSVSQIWNILEYFAKKRGVVYSNEKDLHKIVPQKDISTKICRLNKCLKNFIRMNENPIKSIEHDDDRNDQYDGKVLLYKAAFNIEWHVGAFPVQFTNWDEITIEEVEKNVLCFSYPVKRPVGWKKEYAGFRDDTASVQYSLFEMELAHQNGRPNNTGKAFLDLLREGGEIFRDKNDEDMKELEKFLMTFFNRTDSPFEDRSNNWKALFEACSKVE